MDFRELRRMIFPGDEKKSTRTSFFVVRKKYRPYANIFHPRNNEREIYFPGLQCAGYFVPLTGLLGSQSSDIHFHQKQ